MMMMDPSSSNRVAGGGGAQFPAGLRVLVVDDDPTCLMILQKMLRNCLYQGNSMELQLARAREALDMLREKKDGFDIVLSDVYMPDMDGFKLLEHIGLEMDLPVIMMSADDSKELVMKGVKHGACDYLIKPVRIEALKNIWQHVVRRRKNDFIDDLKDSDQSVSGEENEKQRRFSDENDHASSANGTNWKNKKRKDEKEEEDETDEREDSSTLKKPRVVWSVDLHQQFVAAVNQLGVDKAVPKKILELMNVPGLTRENVASHLQKYRLYLRRAQNHNRNDMHLGGTAEGMFGSITSINGLDLQALAVSGQLTPQNFSAYQAGSRRLTNTRTGLPIADQINFLNYDSHVANSKTGTIPGQDWNSEHMNFQTTASRAMELRKLGQPQQMMQSFGTIGSQVAFGTSTISSDPLPSSRSSPFVGGSINDHQTNTLNMQMTQRGQFSISQPQNHSHNDMSEQVKGLFLNVIAERGPSFSSTEKQQVLANDIHHQTFSAARTATSGDSLPSGGYVSASYPVSLQTSYSSIPKGRVIESAGSSYPVVSTGGSSNLNSSTTFREPVLASGKYEAKNGLTGANDLTPRYDLLTEISQNEDQVWKQQNMNLPYESADLLASKQNVEFCSSLSAHQDLIAALKDGNVKNTFTTDKDIFAKTEFEHGKLGSVTQQNGSIVHENSVKLKAETMPDLTYQDLPFSEDIFPDELMKVIGKQQQEGIGQIDPDFNFDGFPLDNIPV